MVYTEVQIRREAELRVFKRLVTEVYPAGIVSIVSDTFDFWNAITVISAKLKNEILNRIPDQFGLAKVVFRPDSGDPVKILCGEKINDHSSCEDVDYAADIEARNLTIMEEISAGHGECGRSVVSSIFKYKEKYYQVTIQIDWNRYDKRFYYTDGYELLAPPFEVQLTSEQKGAVQVLWEIFGGTTNALGYKTLNQRVGLIYGDSITPAREEEIFKQLMAKGFAADNSVFGVGSFTYQYVTRDTLGFAMKSTYVVRDGVGQAIFKDPVTDSGTKKSARGLLRVEKEGNDFVLYQDQTPEQEKLGVLRTVFKNGDVPFVETYENIRKRLVE